MITLGNLEFYTVDEVSTYLRQSNKTTYRHIYKGKFKKILQRSGNKYLFPVEEFKKLMNITETKSSKTEAKKIEQIDDLALISSYLNLGLLKKLNALQNEITSLKERIEIQAHQQQKISLKFWQHS